MQRMAEDMGGPPCPSGDGDLSHALAELRATPGGRVEGFLGLVHEGARHGDDLKRILEVSAQPTNEHEVRQVPAQPRRAALPGRDAWSVTTENADALCVLHGPGEGQCAHVGPPSGGGYGMGAEPACGRQGQPGVPCMHGALCVTPLGVVRAPATHALPHGSQAPHAIDMSLAVS